MSEAENLFVLAVCPDRPSEYRTTTVHKKLLTGRQVTTNCRLVDEHAISAAEQEDIISYFYTQKMQNKGRAQSQSLGTYHHRRKINIRKVGMNSNTTTKSSYYYYYYWSIHVQDDTITGGHS